MPIIRNLGLAASLLLAGAAGALAQTKLTYATYLSDTYVNTQLDIWFMDEVEKRSNGEIEFERYFSGSLLKAAELLPALNRGSIDLMGGAPGAYNKNDVPLTNLVQPFITTNLPAVTHAVRDLYESNEDLRNEYEAQGSKLLFRRAYSTNTMWSTKSVVGVDDLKGMKVRAVSPVSDMLAKVGVVPVGISWPEAVEGMERGIVDGVSSAVIESVTGTGLQEVIKNATDLGGMGVYGASVTAMNLDTYNSLSPELQKIIDQVAFEAYDKGIELGDPDTDKSVAILCASKDLNISIFSEADAERMRQEAGKPVQDEWVAATSQQTGVDAGAILDEFTKLVKKYEQEVSYVPGIVRAAECQQ